MPKGNKNLNAIYEPIQGFCVLVEGVLSDTLCAGWNTSKPDGKLLALSIVENVFVPVENQENVQIIKCDATVNAVLDLEALQAAFENALENVVVSVSQDGDWVVTVDGVVEVSGTVDIGNPEALAEAIANALEGLEVNATLNPDQLQALLDAINAIEFVDLDDTANDLVPQLVACPDSCVFDADGNVKQGFKVEKLVFFGRESQTVVSSTFVVTNLSGDGSAFDYTAEGCTVGPCPEDETTAGFELCPIELDGVITGFIGFTPNNDGTITQSYLDADFVPTTVKPEGTKGPTFSTSKANWTKLCNDANEIVWEIDCLPLNSAGIPQTGDAKTLWKLTDGTYTDVKPEGFTPCVNCDYQIFQYHEQRTYSGIENSFTRPNQSLVIETENTCGDIRNVSIDAQAASNAWGPQMLEWEAKFAAAYPELCEVKRHWWEWRDAFLPNTGAGSIPPADFDFNAAFGQFIQFEACPADVDKLPIRATIIERNGVTLKTPIELVIGTGQGEVIYHDVKKSCVEGCESEEVPKCAIPVEAPLPSVPEPLCQTTTIQTCEIQPEDDSDPETEPTPAEVITQSVYVNFTFCVGEAVPTISAYTLDADGNADEHQLTAGNYYGDCSTLEPIDTPIKECPESAVFNPVQVGGHYFILDNSNWIGAPTAHITNGQNFEYTAFLEDGSTKVAQQTADPMFANMLANFATAFECEVISVCANHTSPKGCTQGGVDNLAAYPAYDAPTFPADIQNNLDNPAQSELWATGWLFDCGDCNAKITRIEITNANDAAYIGAYKEPIIYDKPKEIIYQAVTCDGIFYKDCDGNDIPAPSCCPEPYAGEGATDLSDNYECCETCDVTISATYATVDYTITGMLLGGVDVSSSFTLPVDGNNAPAFNVWRDELRAFLAAQGIVETNYQLGRDGFALSYTGEKLEVVTDPVGTVGVTYENCTEIKGLPVIVKKPIEVSNLHTKTCVEGSNIYETGKYSIWIGTPESDPTVTHGIVIDGVAKEVTIDNTGDKAAMVAALEAAFSAAGCDVTVEDLNPDGSQINITIDVDCTSKVSEFTIKGVKSEQQTVEATAVSDTCIEKEALFTSICKADLDYLINGIVTGIVGDGECPCEDGVTPNKRCQSYANILTSGYRNWIDADDFEDLADEFGITPTANEMWVRITEFKCDGVSQSSEGQIFGPYAVGATAYSQLMTDLSSATTGKCLHVYESVGGGSNGSNGMMYEYDDTQKATLVLQEGVTVGGGVSWLTSAQGIAVRDGDVGDFISSSGNGSTTNYDAQAAADLGNYTEAQDCEGI